MTRATTLRSAALGATASMFLLLARDAHAGCTQRAEIDALRASLQAALRCDLNVLQLGTATGCSVPAAPACAGTLVSDVRALVFGPNDPAAAKVTTTGAGKPSYDCQSEVAKVAFQYAGNKLYQLVGGLSEAQADASAAPYLDSMITKCTGVATRLDSTGVVLPAVGEQCSAALGAPGATFDPAVLRGCMHTLLDVWTNRIGPAPQPLRPNVVLVLTDDQRWDATGPQHSLNGADVMPRTRAELAASGLELTNVFSTTPLCAPSRASLLTGQYAHTHGVTNERRAQRGRRVRRHGDAGDRAAGGGLPDRAHGQVPERLRQALDERPGAVRPARLG
jgi:hypothetical protein